MCFIVTENGTLLKRLFVQRLGPVATISLAQLFGTSLWFSANGISDSLALVWQASVKDIGWLTNAVQLGFIFGTLVISLTGIADRYRASTLYIISALTGAVLNAGFAWLAGGVISGALFRFGVGICLAGIYPMGMKLIVSWVSGKTGLALSVLVAMLTLGTALPHGLRVLGADVSWQVIISASSALALLSAAVIGVIGDGPYQPQNPEPNTTLAHVRMSSGSILRVFDISGFRAASLGYFGHMWELYTFWTIIPMIIQHTSLALVWPQLGGAGLAFCLIGVGAFGSVTGGMLSQCIGSEKVATLSLAISGLCCFIFVTCWQALHPVVLLLLLLTWGATVVADSPQFSSLTARACPVESVGSALAIQNSIGFAITVVSIAITTTLFGHIGLSAIWLLLPGPVFGLIGFFLNHRQQL